MLGLLPRVGTWPSKVLGVLSRVGRRHSSVLGGLARLEMWRSTVLGDVPRLGTRPSTRCLCLLIKGLRWNLRFTKDDLRAVLLTSDEHGLTRMQTEVRHEFHEFWRAVGAHVCRKNAPENYQAPKERHVLCLWEKYVAPTELLNFRGVQQPLGSNRSGFLGRGAPPDGSGGASAHRNGFRMDSSRSDG